MAIFAIVLAGCTILPSASDAKTNQPTGPGGVILDLSPEAVITENGNLDADELLALGDAAFDAGDMAQARDYYDQAIAVDAYNAEAYQKRGRMYAAVGIPDLAIANFNQALAFKADYADPYYLRGIVYLLAGNLEQARLDFSAAIMIDPSLAEAYRYRGTVEMELGLVEPALIDFEVYLALVPDAEDQADVREWIAELAGLVEQAEIIADAPPGGSIFFDDFSNSDSGWIGGASAPGFGAYDSDGYRIIVTTAESAVWARPTLWLRDVRIEVDTKKSGGPDNNFFGVLCRYQSSENFYALIISSDGYYGIARRFDGGALELVGMAVMPHSRAIREGAASNRIVAECMGNLLRLSVNGVVLVEMYDSTLGAGDVGIIVGAFLEIRPNILFDNFIVYDLGG